MGLVAGLVLGSIGIAGAAVSSSRRADAAVATSAAPCPAPGLQAGRAVRDSSGSLIDVVAKLTGLSAEQIATQLQEGKTFAEIAKAEDVSVDAIVAESLRARASYLDAKVKDGTITEAQKTAILERMTARLTERIASDGPRGLGSGACGGGVGGRGGGARRGLGGASCGGGCAGQPQSGAPAGDRNPITY
jgi:hypothetical protein